MAQQLKIVADASMDLISELPVEVKDRILEYLPTRDAARTALLSTHWRDVWLQHGWLAFDEEFVQSFQPSQNDEGGFVDILLVTLFFLTFAVHGFEEFEVACSSNLVSHGLAAIRKL
nr:F-box/FBD/LRR-repeat protein At1g13570-like [Ipomoea batatas]